MSIRQSISFLILLSLLTLVSCAPTNRNIPPQASAGRLDIGNWSFENDGSLQLSGDWGFYWSELHQPEKLHAGFLDTVTYQPVPADWGSYADDQSFSPNGYATYQLQLTGLNSNQIYGIHIGSPSTAYQLWINGEEISGSGVVGTSAETTRPEMAPLSSYFQTENGEATIVVHISNYNHRNSGLTAPITIDTAQGIDAYNFSNRGEDVFLFGIFIIITFYHLGLYFFRRQSESALYFAILTGIIAIRVSVVNDQIIQLIWPNISWWPVVYAEYITFYLGMPAFSRFFYSLYPKDISLKYIRFGYIPAGIYTILVLVEPLLEHSYRLIYYQVFFLIFMVYMLWGLGRTLYNRRDGSTLIAFSVIALTVTTTLDILSIRNVIDLPQVTAYGFIIAIFIQAILIARRFSNAYQLVEDTKEELRQSEQKYRAIFEDSRDVILLLDDNGVIEDASPACERVLGYTRLELQTMRAHQILVDGDTADLFSEAQDSIQAVRDSEIQFQRKDGRIIHGLITISWRYAEDGHTIIGMQGVLRDITNRKKAQALELAKERAEAKTDAKSSFLTRMSHELRTPLNAIIGYTELLQDDAEDNDVHFILPDLDRIRYAGRHLLALINDVLDISKVEEGKMTLHVTRFNLQNVIDIVVADAKTLMQKNNNQLQIEIDPRLKVMEGDETKVKQILFNLLSNAAKFTHNGTVTLSAEAATLQGKPAVQFTMQDNGIGMTPSQLNTVFEPFVQADETITNEYGGTGLGMALTKRFCELMGGTVTAQSEKDVGTVFTTTLPTENIPKT